MTDIDSIEALAQAYADAMNAFLALPDGDRWQPAWKKQQDARRAYLKALESPDVVLALVARLRAAEAVCELMAQKSPAAWARLAAWEAAKGGGA